MTHSVKETDIMIQTIKDLVSAKADTTVALAREIWGYAELSYEETKSAAALVDDAGQRLLQLFPGILRHPLQLGLQIVADHLVKAASENVGLPDLTGVPFKLLKQIIHHVLRLLLITHDGTDRRLNIRPDHVDTGGASLQADAVPPSLLHDLRFLQLQFVDSRHHDAIARFPDIPQRPGHLVIFRLDAGQLCQQTGAFQTHWTLPLSPGPRDGGPWTPFLELSDLFYTISQQKGRYFLQVF